MAKAIEYRVRAVTRYIVTKHDPNRDVTDVVAEVNAQYMANRMAQGLALERVHRDPDQPDPVVHLLDAPLPGRVMRCKVSLGTKMPRIELMYGKDIPGRHATNPDGSLSEYSADHTDPANYRVDGTRLVFNAVWGGQAEDGKNAARENRIFSDMTPCVLFDAVVRNQAVVDALNPGDEYYVDFIPAPKADAQAGA